MNSNERGITMMNEEDDKQIELPPGFRFHPTDEELITYYLSPKVANVDFNSVAIGEVDLNKVEPWELPRKAKMGEKEWYFFCVRDKKYPTGSRTNRATGAGYWKATGKDKEIFSRPKALVGMKKTLVFYTGRAPKGLKTNWVMHEYRLEGKYAKHNLPKSSKNDWVISRVFDKGSNVKKMQIQGDSNINQLLHQQTRSFLPPLMNYSPILKANHSEENWSMSVLNPSHVTCFSSQINTTTTFKEEGKEEQKDNNFKPVDHLNGFINNINYYNSSSGSSVSPSFQFQNQNQQLVGRLAYSVDPPVFLQEQSKPSMEMEGDTIVVGYGGNTCTWTNDQSHDTLTTTDHILLSSGVFQRLPFQGYHYDGPVDLDSLVNY